MACRSCKLSGAWDAQGVAAGLLSRAEAPLRAWSSRRCPPSTLSLFPLALAILMLLQSAPHTSPVSSCVAFPGSLIGLASSTPS